jgi:hypothetical protein
MVGFLCFFGADITIFLRGFWYVGGLNWERWLGKLVANSLLVCVQHLEHSCIIPPI